MQAHFNQAQSFHQAGNFKQAEAIYRQLLQQETDHPVISSRLALLLHQTNRKSEALELFKTAITALPQEYDLLMQGVTTATQLAENELAESWLRMAIAVKPDDITALEQLAGVLIGSHISLLLLEGSIRTFVLKCFNVHEREALVGRLCPPSFLPIYLIRAILAPRSAVHI